MNRITFIVLVALLSSPACLAETPTKPGGSGDREIEVGKHYQVVVAEVEGDEVTTTTYWATAKQADQSSIALGNGEWTQYTGPLVKPRGMVFINRVALWIAGARGRKSVGVGRAHPMGDETVVLQRHQITKISPMTETEFRERQEAHRPSHPRPPHARNESSS